MAEKLKIESLLYGEYLPLVFSILLFSQSQLLLFRK